MVLKEVYNMTISALIPVQEFVQGNFDEELGEMFGAYDVCTARLYNGDYKSYVFKCPEDTIDIDQLSNDFNISELILVTTDCVSFVDVISLSGEYDGFHSSSISSVADMYGIVIDARDDLSDDDYDDQDDWDDGYNDEEYDS